MTHDNPFGLDKLLAFAESKPAGQTFDPRICSDCLIGQYVASLGGRYDRDLNHGSYVIGKQAFDPCGNTDTPEIAKALEVLMPPGLRLLSFGRAADRLRAALSKAATP